MPSKRPAEDALRLYQPTIGFLVNRLQHAILHEAYYLIEAGVASAADIDHAARRLLAPRMCLNGLIQQKDISGLKIHADAQRSIVPALFHNGVPSPMLQAMVARGQTGLNAGKGFYDWSGADPERERVRISHALTALLAFLDTLDSEPARAQALRPAHESVAILARTRYVAMKDSVTRDRSCPASRFHRCIVSAARLARSGCASTVASLMAEADLQGSDGHGVIRLPHYARRIRAGGLSCVPTFACCRSGPAWR
mgnify:CR=1 FL=1